MVFKLYSRKRECRTYQVLVYMIVIMLSYIFVKELVKLVLKKWGKSFQWERSMPFQFKNEVIVFHPEEVVQDGWKLICNTLPPAVSL